MCFFIFLFPCMNEKRITNKQLLPITLQAKDLRRYYSLQFITSSLEKKAEVAKLKVQLNQDSTCVPVDDSVASQDVSKKDKDNTKKPQIKLAYDIAASAASYVQLRAKDIFKIEP